MSSILDIDLDYFNLVGTPVQRLRELLAWAGRRTLIVFEKHHHALREWRRLIIRGDIVPPCFILHVDEHHDMMDEMERPNIANMVYHAMRTWRTCRVHWLTVSPIDSPAMWLSEETWHQLESRFTVGDQIPGDWPAPDIVSVSTSPGFVPQRLSDNLGQVIQEHIQGSNRSSGRRKSRR